MNPARALVVELVVAAPIDVVWNALRDRVAIAQWFGWNHADLPAEVEFIFFDADAKADDPDTAFIDVRVGAEGRQAGCHVHRDAVVCQPGEMRHHLRHVGVAELHAMSGTVEQFRCERDVSVLGQPLADVLDVVIDAECFLQDEQRRQTARTLGCRPVRVHRSVGGVERQRCVFHESCQ